MKARYLIGLAFLYSFDLSAASFDCNQELSKIENMICSDQNASNLDHELVRKYELEMRFASSEGKSRIKKDQQEWLREVRNKCEEVECIKDAYMIRIYHLDNYGSNSVDYNLSYDGEYYYVRSFYQTNERVDSFNASIAIGKAIDGKISQCSILIDVPVGVAKGNHSYGGLCTLRNAGKEQRVLICNDEMVGHFEMEFTLEIPDINDLAIFVVNNCYGG